MPQRCEACEVLEGLNSGSRPPSHIRYTRTLDMLSKYMIRGRPRRPACVKFIARDCIVHINRTLIILWPLHSFVTLTPEYRMSIVRHSTPSVTHKPKRSRPRSFFYVCTYTTGVQVLVCARQLARIERPVDLCQRRNFQRQVEGR